MLVIEKEDAEISMGEVLGAIKKMNSGKSSRIDGVKLEYLKSGRKVGAEWMVRMLNIRLTSGSVPKEWKIGCIIPFISENRLNVRIIEV